MAKDRPATDARRDRLREGREAPDRPKEVGGRFAVLKRAFTEFTEDNMTDWAAALTYYGVLSLFPALIAFVGIIGLAAALWSASGYVGAFMRASNIIYETPEGRPFWKLRPLQILVTLIMVILLALVALALTLTGPIVEEVAGPLGFSDAAITLWEIGKWPVLVAVVVTKIAILYYPTPHVKL